MTKGLVDELIVLFEESKDFSDSTLEYLSPVFLKAREIYFEIQNNGGGVKQ